MNVKQAWKIVNMITKMSAITLLLFSSVSYAGVEIIDQSDSDTVYGNGQNANFRRAMQGEAPIEEQDQAFLDSISIKRPDNRSYLRARLGRPKFELKKITNVSGGSSTAPTVPETNEKLWQWSFAYGYKWENWIIEAELLMAEGAHYDASPMLQGTPPQLGTNFALRSRIKNYTPMLNIEYEFGNELAFLPKRLHFYLNAGVGAALLKAEANTYDLTTNAPMGAESRRKASFTWNLGAGFRYDIIGNLLFDVSYRFIDFGKTQIGPVSGATLKIDDVLSSGLYAGIVYRI